MKEARLGVLTRYSNFHFFRADIADRDAMNGVAQKHPDISRFIHLAAQAGVRYLAVNPYAYCINIDGHLVMLEWPGI